MRLEAIADFIYSGTVSDEEPCAEEYEDTTEKRMSLKEFKAVAEQLLGYVEHENHIHISGLNVEGYVWDEAEKIGKLFGEAKKILQPVIDIHQAIVKNDAAEFGTFTPAPFKGAKIPILSFNAGPQSPAFAKRGKKGKK